MAEILSVMGLFLLRVGIPLLALIVLGLLVDRWQTRRNEQIQRVMEKRTLEFGAHNESKESKNGSDKHRKAA